MSARILYHERRELDAGQYRSESNQFVLVELRKWTDTDHHDTILEERVVVDGEEVVNSTRVLGGYSDAAHIRHAIAAFDAHVSAHPWANGEPRETDACRQCDEPTRVGHDLCRPCLDKERGE